jgi:hypothetical protein
MKFRQTIVLDMQRFSIQTKNVQKGYGQLELAASYVRDINVFSLMGPEIFTVGKSERSIPP